jgi:hypothetical protein
MSDGFCVAQKQMCQIRGRGILRGGLGVVYLADNAHIGYNLFLELVKFLNLYSNG